MNETDASPTPAGPRHEAPLGMRRLYEALGALLDDLRDVPEMHDPTRTQWRIGRQADGETALDLACFGKGAPLATVAALYGGEIRRKPEPFEHSDGSRVRMHTLHTTYRGVPLRVTAWLPEPTEREALLARLAELDAAERADGPAGGAGSGGLEAGRGGDER